MQIHENTTADIRVSEERYGSIVNNLHEIVFSMDTKGQLNYLNPAWHVNLGYDIQQSIGKPFVDFIADEDKLTFHDFMLSGWIQTPLKLRLFTKSRELRFMELSLNRTDPEKRNNDITGLLVDVTEKELISKELAENKDRFELVVKASNDGLWDWDLRTDKAYFSDRWKFMLGYAPEDIGDDLIEWSSRVHPEDISLAIAALNQHLRGDTIHYECIIRMQHKDKSWRWILTRGISVKDANGVALRMAGSHTDLTALKLAEESLKLREQEQKAIIEICPDGILSISDEGRVNFINSAFLAITGIAAEDIVDKSSQTLFKKLFDNFTVDGKPSLGDFNACQNTGDTLSILDCISCKKFVSSCKNVELTLRDSHSLKVIRLISRIQDVGTIKQMLYLRDITVEYEVDRMKSEFLSNAAHELRTPMTIIYGFTELLMAQDFDKKMQLDIIQTIHNQTKTLTHIINDLLDIARIESRKGEDFVMRTQAIQPIILEIKKEWDGLADAARINFDVSAEIPHVLVDKEKIKQAIINVLSNACKYSKAESLINVTIVYKENAENMFVGIQVRDQGHGMTPEQLSHLFERFWRANASGDVSGTGLGMTIIKSIVDTHQGHIDVQSEPQKGTMITLWFPSVHAHEAAIM